MASLSISRCRAAYGVDLGRQRLIVVRAERSGAVATLWNDVAEAARLKPIATEISASVSTGRALLAAALPATDGFARWLETPLTAPEKALKVLSSLLDVQLPFPLETCLYDFSFLRPGAGKNFRALACAARCADVETRLAQHHEFGLDPVLLQHEGVALWRQALAEIPLAPKAQRIVAYLGDARTTLAVGSGTAGGEIIGLHGIRLGSAEFVAPDLSAMRQWAGRVVQILRALPATASDEPVQWLWCGPGAEAAPALERALAQSDRVRFKTVSEPAAFLARSLAFAALAGETAGQLRNGKLTHPALLAYAGRLRGRTAFNLLAAGSVLLVLGIGWNLWLQQTDKHLQEEILVNAQQLTSAKNIPYGQEVVTVQRMLKQREAELQPFQDALAPTAARDLAGILAAARELHVTIEALQYSGKSLLVRGATDDWNHCDPLVTRLRALGYAVELSREEAGLDELVRFTLKGTRR